jgi:hypothetical protein
MGRFQENYESVTFRSGRNQVEECVRARLDLGEAKMLEEHPDFSKPTYT